VICGTVSEWAENEKSHSKCMFVACNMNELVSSVSADLRRLICACTLLCSHCKKIGAQTLVLVAIIVTEVLITFKFDWQTFTKPLPGYVVVGWIIGLAALAIWTIWHFYLQRLLTHTEVRSLAENAAESREAGANVSDSNELNGSVRRRKARAANAR